MRTQNLPGFAGRALQLCLFLLVAPFSVVHGLGTLEVRGLVDSLNTESTQAGGRSWEAAVPVRLSWDFGGWAEGQVRWGWGGGSYQGAPGAPRWNNAGDLPLGFSLRARSGQPEGSRAFGMVGYASAGDLALNRGRRAGAALFDPGPDRGLLGGSGLLRLEAGAESRWGRGRWRLTLWSEDQGAFPAEGLEARLDPGTAGGLEFQARLGRDREERVAVTLKSERQPSYRESSPGSAAELFRAHYRNELRLEGWAPLGRNLALGLILMENDRSVAQLPAQRGPAPALWGEFRTGPGLEAVLGLRHWLPGGANAFYSGGVSRQAGNGAPAGSDIRDDGLRGFFLGAEAETAIDATTGIGWKGSWTKAKDEGVAPDSSPGEAGRCRTRLRVELILYRVL